VLQVMLAAVHPFDTHGAKAAGLQAAFIDRSACQEFPPFYLPPDVTVESIPALADRMKSAR
jgi:2-haloacid dehalogenase